MNVEEKYLMKMLNEESQYSNNTRRIRAQLLVAIDKGKKADKIIDQLIKSAYDDGFDSRRK
jgi:hypothetical protein